MAPPAGRARSKERGASRLPDARIDHTPFLENKSRGPGPLARLEHGDCSYLLRAGATLPAHTTNAYIQKVIAAGGIDHYERTHLATLTAFTSKLDLPARPARRVAEYAFHAGFY